MDSNAVAKKSITLRVNLLVSKRSANARFRLQSIPITRVQAVPRTSAAAVALAALRRWVLNATTIKKPFPGMQAPRYRFLCLQPQRIARTMSVRMSESTQDFIDNHFCEPHVCNILS